MAAEDGFDPEIAALKLIAGVALAAIHRLDPDLLGIARRSIEGIAAHDQAQARTLALALQALDRATAQSAAFPWEPQGSA